MKSLISSPAKLLFVPLIATAVLLSACNKKDANTEPTADAPATQTQVDANQQATATATADSANGTATVSTSDDTGHEQHDQVAVAGDDIGVAEASDANSHQ